MKKKILTALLSLVIAFGLWLYVITIVAPESEQTYFDVPIKLHGSNVLESQGLMLISDENLTLDLKLQGTRTDLNKLTSSNITVIADLSGITSAGRHTISYNISYPGIIAGEISVVSPEKQTIDVVLVEWAKKEVTIEVEYTGTLPSDYTADRKNVQLNRNTVTVSGEKSVVERIEKATISIDLTDHTEDIVQDYALTFRDANGAAVTLNNVTCDATEVTASLKIDMLKTLPLVVEVIPGGGMVQEDIQYEILERDHIMVAGPAATLANLDQITLTIDLSQLSATQTMRFPIELPEGVTNVTGISQVMVYIVVPEMTTKEFTINWSQFTLVNVPEGMTVAVQTENLIIEVRGRENRLEELQTEDIRILIDFSDAVEGSAQYTVTIEIDNVDGVGVTQEYTVYVNVSFGSPDGPEG